MSNMSYCRFENTSHDLEDCVFAMQNAESLEEMDLSRYEKASMLRMLDLCRDFVKRAEELEVAELDKELGYA